jgi:RHS repeat-associated protein
LSEETYTYDAVGHVAESATSNTTGAGTQITKYVYGVSPTTGSNVSSNNLLYLVEYPDPTTGNPSTSASNQEMYKYNALGDTISYTDPNGTVHVYGYDVLGRSISDSATVGSTGVSGISIDTSITKLTTAYNSVGDAYLYTSLSPGGSVVNQVMDIFNGLGDITAEYQAISGAVNTSTTPYVGYAYNVPTNTSAANNNDRTTSTTYPNGRQIDYVYNSGLDTAISRVSALADDVSGTPSSTPLEAYTYLGLDTVVQRSHPQNGVSLSYINSSATSGNRYTGLDAFDRVIDQNWSVAGTAIDRLQYAYDNDGDVLYTNNLVVANDSQLYQANGALANSAYDPLGRITNFSQGPLSASGNNGTQLDQVVSPGGKNPPTITTESWNYDSLGNWSSRTTNTTTTSRTFNAQNQTASITSSAGTTPVYDHDGNEVTDSTGLRYIYDAWNRPTAVLQYSGKGTIYNALADYSYDALGRRDQITNPYITNTTNTIYFSANDQPIEERSAAIGSTPTLLYQYVWSLAGDNQMVLRDQFSSGTLSQRLYVEQDPNGNVTSLTNTSGVVVARFLYDPYGNATFMNAAGTAPGTPVSWDYLFQGGRRDPYSGRVEFGARDYIPFEGKWAERDPLGLDAGDPNIYEFGWSNPTDFTDPSGLEPSDGFGWSSSKESQGDGPQTQQPAPSAGSWRDYDPVGFWMKDLNNPGWSAGTGVAPPSGYLDQAADASRYLGTALQQALLGDFSSNQNALGTALQAGAAFTPLDTLADARDTAAAALDVAQDPTSARKWGALALGGAAILIPCLSVGVLRKFAGAVPTSAADDAAGGLKQLDNGGAPRQINGPCFAAGTHLMTPDGSKPIEEFRAGDVVLSRPEEDPDGPLVAKPVLRTSQNYTPILKLVAGDRVILTTAEHPFWIVGKGWIDAHQIEKGDLVIGATGETTPITAIEGPLPPATVYNLEIKDYHTYLVTGPLWGFSVWSHNNAGLDGVIPCAADSSAAPSSALLSQGQQSAIRKIDNTISGHLKPGPKGDISGTVSDMVGNPIPKPSGGYWDHVQEMQNTLRGLRNQAATLEGVTNPVAQAARQRALDAISEIEAAIKGAGL